MHGRRRGEGSPPYGGLHEVRRGRRADVGIGPYGEVTSSAVGRADRGVRPPYGGFTKGAVGRGMPYTHTYAYTLYTPAKASQSLPPAGGKKFKSFFTATCAWGKIPLRLPVWNFAACDKIMRAADCKPLWQKIP